MIEDAAQNDLWIICPPPSRDVVNATKHLNRVIFWLLDPATTRKADLSTAVEQLRLWDPRHRLLVGSAEIAADLETLHRVSRSTDIVLLDFNGGTEVDESLVSQFDRFDQANRKGIQRITWARLNSSTKSFHQSGVEQTLAAVAAGANGIWFASDEPLTSDSPRLHLRRTTIEAANLKLQSIRPWVVGVGQRRLITRSKTPTMRVSQLMTNDAGLLLIVHNSDADFGDESIIITSPSTTESSDAFQVLPTGLRPLKSRRVTGGQAITLHDIDSTCPIVVTENNLATNQLARFASATRRRSVAIQKSLAEASLRFAESDSASNVNSARIAREMFDRGRQLLDSGDSTNAYHAFQNARRELYR